MSECNHDCSHCGQDCQDRIPIEQLNPKSSVKHVIGVVSGKGGVGKSLVSALMAVSAQRKGFRAAVLDADITGPSIPKLFGATQKAVGTEEGVESIKTSTGIQIMSINSLMEDDTDPVVWRGPIIAGAVKQFWTDVIWEDVDYMFVDMPPGTGDVPLTVFQSLPIEGIIMVATPQDLVGLIVSKAAKMAGMMDIPVLALVENMSYFVCPECGHQYNIFGQSRVDELAAKFGLQTTAKIPVDPSLAALCDAGRIEDFDGEWLSHLVKEIEK